MTLYENLVKLNNNNRNAERIRIRRSQFDAGTCGGYLVEYENLVERYIDEIDLDSLVGELQRGEICIINIGALKGACDYIDSVNNSKDRMPKEFAQKFREAWHTIYTPESLKANFISSLLGKVSVNIIKILPNNHVIIRGKMSNGQLQSIEIHLNELLTSFKDNKINIDNLNQFI